MEITSPKGRKFASIQQMTDAIQKDLDEISRKILEEVAEEVRLKMEELILNFYDDYRPNYYKRTGGLLNAVRNTQSTVYKTKDGYKVRIKLFDTTQMDQEFADKPYFNSYLDFSNHASYGGKLYTDWVVDWIDSGGIYGHKPIEYKKEINDLLDKKVNEGILRELKRAGYNLYK